MDSEQENSISIDQRGPIADEANEKDQKILSFLQTKCLFMRVLSFITCCFNLPSEETELSVPKTTSRFDSQNDCNDDNEGNVSDINSNNELEIQEDIDRNDSENVDLSCNDFSIDISCDSNNCDNNRSDSFSLISNCDSFISTTSDLPNYLNENIIDDLIERGKNEPNQSYSDLEFVIDKVFSNPEKLSQSFRIGRNPKVSLKKPKDLNESQVDFKSLRCSMKKIFSMDNMLIRNALNISIVELFNLFKVPYATEAEIEVQMHCIVICLELTSFLGGLDYSALEFVCDSVTRLNILYQARLAHIWAKHCKDTLYALVQCCQERITGILNYETDKCIHEQNRIKPIIKLLSITFYANMIGGDDQLANISKRFYQGESQYHFTTSGINSHRLLIPFEKFYNDEISKILERSVAIHVDYLNYLLQFREYSYDENEYFTFRSYPFILSPEAKIKAFHYEIESRIVEGVLILNIRRDKIVHDVLNELEVIATEIPGMFKRNLAIQFIDEDASDLGGVSREFFQIIVEKFFDNVMDLFNVQEDSKTVWFSFNSPEKMSMYRNVGIILGLAVINKINLPVNFPMVIFRKLLLGTGSFHDLEDISPTLFRSLKDLLNYEDDDMEDCFMQTFQISTTNATGQVIQYDLKPNGGNISVGQHNKQEFVDLYSDFLLNKSVKEQFEALQTGFEMVTDELSIKELFKSEEFELLLCGSKTFNFMELEEVTDYDGGYTKDSKVIQDFWSIVHDMTDEMKRKLLEFTTGSDRVPVGGLRKLKFVILHNGFDNERLPSSHTCFNVLLLPEYKTKEQLKERLFLALKYTRGFGMI